MVIATIRSGYGIFMGVWLNQIYHIRLWEINPVVRFGAFMVLFGILCLPSFGYFDGWLDLTISIVFIPICIFLLACQKNPKSAKIIWTAYFLGNISYPIYVIHFPIMLLCKIFIPQYIPIYKNYSGLCFLIFSVIAAHLLFKYFDTPHRRWLMIIAKKSNLLKIPTKV